MAADAIARFDPDTFWPAHPSDDSVEDGNPGFYTGAAGVICRSLRLGRRTAHQGTGGNGYAFLKLHRRTNDPVWLDRARQFAMTAIVQHRGARSVAGRGRYTLWTGDVGLAAFLWDCITGDPRFPTIDVF